MEQQNVQDFWTNKEADISGIPQSRLIFEMQDKANEQITKDFVTGEKLLGQTQTTSSLSLSSIYSLIYVTECKEQVEGNKSPLKAGTKPRFIEENLGEINDISPLFFSNVDIIYVPKKALRDLKRNVSKSYLKAIDKDENVSIEKCLLMLSNISSTVFSEERFKTLNSTLLHEQTQKGNDNTRIYPRILEALKYSGNTSAFIESRKNYYDRDTYRAGVNSKAYALTETYYKAGLKEYRIKNKAIVAKRRKYFYNQLSKAHDNVIARNLIILYSKIDLPNNNDLFLEAKRLIRLKWITKKGKILTLLNNHSKSYFKNIERRSFVEDNIKLYDFLTKKNYLIPSIGNERSGGRVVDSFTLMPSWIRTKIKIDGEPIVEVDFKALHPNIAMSLYNGSKRYLTHDLVAQESNIDIVSVKTAHLSYFNQKVLEMKRSPLYRYYNEHETEMNERVIAEKLSSSNKHKITSMRMFAKEVEIMTECIKRLNAKGMYVGYIYDALFCKEGDAETVKKIMDEVVLELGVYTTAKISEAY